MFSVYSKVNHFQRTSYSLVKNLKYYSVQNEINTSLTENLDKFKDKTVNISRRVKLPPRQPLTKNFFLGIVDKEILSFPEVISRDEMSTLYKEVNSIEDCFQNDICNTPMTDDFNKELLNNLKNLGLFGLNVSQLYNGKEYCMSESLIASQFEIQRTNVASFLLPHRIVCDVINTHGTEQQKQKYLSKLANGSLIGTDAILELNDGSNQYFNTVADLDTGTNLWTLNGKKSFFTTIKADVFLILAETSHLDNAGVSAKGITLFLLEINQPGVKVSECQNSYGHSVIEFDNVILSNDNIIGQPSVGTEVAQLLLNNSRIRSSYIGFGMMKNLINKATKYVIETKSCGVALKDMESITTSLSKIVCNAYATESMVYLTTGLIDEFENQDIDVESAILKLYTLNSLRNSIHSILDFMGSKYLLPEQQIENDFKDLIKFYTQGESADSLQLFIALSGLRHAGMSLHETVNKQRNPLFNPGHILNKFFQSTSILVPKTNMSLNEELHPSLEAASQNLEHSIYRLGLCTEMLLTRYGNEIVMKHSEIKRLAEMVTLIYASFASLARASRSYCIGLRLADYEMLIASTIALNANDRIKELAIEIEQGPFITNDVNYQRISKQILQSKGYFSENPLKFNY